jgi:integrase
MEGFEEFLKNLLESGILNRVTAEEHKPMKNERLYLQNHNHKVWKGTDGFWRTKVPDEDYTDGLKLIKRKTKESLLNAVANHYKDHPVSVTFKTRFDVWVDRQIKCGRSANTVYKYKSDYNRFFKDTEFESGDIRYLTDEDIMEHIKNVLEEKKIRWRALKDIFGYMNGVFEKSFKDHIISENPCKYVDLEIFKRLCKNDTVHTYKDRTLSDKERLYLLEKLHNPIANNNNHIAALAIELALYTGMRVGELVALEWGDILKDEGIIVIRHSEKFNKLTKEYTIENTKNSRVRFFPITDEILDVLTRIRKFEEEHDWLGRYIFTNESGRIHANVVSSSVRNRTMSSEFSNPKSIHALRRTLNSNLRCNGVSATVAASLLGHTERVNDMNYTYDVEALSKKKEYIEIAGKVTGK